MNDRRGIVAAVLAVAALAAALVSPGTARSAAADPGPCIASGTDASINAALVGPGAAAVLCPGAVFDLTGSVVLDAPGQSVTTQGDPTGPTRAVLRIVDPSLSVALRFTGQSDVTIGSVVVDGNRTGLGFEPTSGSGGTGDALLAGGGSSTGQVVEHVLAEDARSWSALHITEGPPASPCEQASVHDDEIIGPTAAQGQWSDGISFACTDSQVVDNTVTDASDGGIVVFGAPGSLIADNIVQSVHQEELGGINLVDFAPYGGDDDGTVVRDNTVMAVGAPMHIGIAQGWGAWFCSDDPADYTANVLHGASVLDNTIGGPQLIYGMTVSGVEDWTVAGNQVAPNQIAQRANSGCNGTRASNPTALLYESARAGGSFQPGFVDGHVHGDLFAVTSWGHPVTVRPPPVLAPAPTTVPPASVPPTSGTGPTTTGPTTTVPGTTSPTGTGPATGSPSVPAATGVVPGTTGAGAAPGTSGPAATPAVPLATAATFTG